MEVSMQCEISRVFVNGNSQAVRIPQEFRLDVSQVAIFRNEDGDLVIHPLPRDRGKAVLDAFCQFDTEFASILEEDRMERSATQEREEL
jgi:antitoxin VapB